MTIHHSWKKCLPRICGPLAEILPHVFPECGHSNAQNQQACSCQCEVSGCGGITVETVWRERANSDSTRTGPTQAPEVLDQIIDVHAVLKRVPRRWWLRWL